MKVDFFRHRLGAADAEKIARVLSTPFLTSGSVCASVEDRLCRYFETGHAALTNSWTNGAVSVLLAMGIGPGDEVVVPAQTFIATANVVELVGATPVFADVDPETFLMEVEHVRPHLSERTKAVIPVHLYGQMVDVRALRSALHAFSPSRRIRIIEDCAHCFEGTLDGERPGGHSDAAVFSFYGTKNVTCGEGGAIITNDGDLHGAILQTRLHGMSAMAADRFRGQRYNHWDMLRLGTKANLPDLLAALLPEQIDTVDETLELRHRLAERYRRAFSGGALQLPAVRPSAKSAEHLFTIGVPEAVRDASISALNEAGISVTVNYRAVTDTAYYSGKYPDAATRTPVSVAWGRRTISLPLFPGLTADEQDHVISTVEKVVYPLARTTSAPVGEFPA